MTERVLLRVGKGTLTPADDMSRQRLKGRAFNLGDEVFAELKKPRNPRFHRLAHIFGQMLVDNVEAFSGMDAHSVLKRLQLEAGVECDEILIQMPGEEPGFYRIPRSISFESLDEDAFQKLYAAMCQHVRDRYWPQLQTAEDVEDIARLMGEGQ